MSGATVNARDAAPIDMVLHCPECGMQHIDSDARNGKMHAVGCNISCGIGWTCSCTFGLLWTNPPHRSHLCHGCGHIWRPADVPTNGVQAIKTKGRSDHPVASSMVLAQGPSEAEMHKALVKTGRFNKRSQGYIMGAFRAAMKAGAT